MSAFCFDFPEIEGQEHLIVSSAIVAADHIGVGNAINSIPHQRKAFDAVVCKRMCCDFYIHMHFLEKLQKEKGGFSVL